MKTDQLERKLSGGEKRSKEAHFKKLKKHRAKFVDRYGKKDGEAVMHAIATNRAKGVKEAEEHTYTVVHAKHGKAEVKASSSYGAAKKYAEMKGLKNTSGVDAHLHTKEDDSHSVKGFDPKSIKTLADLKVKYPHAGDTLDALLRAYQDLKDVSDAGSDANALNIADNDQQIADLEKRISKLEKQPKKNKSESVNEISDEEAERYKDNPAMLKALQSIEQTFNPHRNKVDDKVSAMIRSVEMLKSERFRDRVWPMLEPYGINSREDLLAALDDTIASETKVMQSDKEGMIQGPERNIKQMRRAQDKLTAMEEGYTILPPMDTDKYQPRAGLEGPIPTKSGKVVYYDPKEGAYYDPDTDMYLSYDEWKALNEGVWDTVKNVAGKVGSAVKNFVTPGSVKQARKKPIGNKGSLAKQINMPGFQEDAGTDVLMQLRSIVDQKQATKIHGMMVDMFTASAIVQVYDKVNNDNQRKMQDMLRTPEGMSRIADFAISKVG